MSNVVSLSDYILWTSNRHMKCLVSTAWDEQRTRLAARVSCERPQDGAAVHNRSGTDDCTTPVTKNARVPTAPRRGFKQLAGLETWALLKICQICEIRTFIIMTRKVWIHLLMVGILRIHMTYKCVIPVPRLHSQHTRDAASQLKKNLRVYL